MWLTEQKAQFLEGVREFGAKLRFVKSHEHPRKTVVETYFVGSSIQSPSISFTTVEMIHEVHISSSTYKVIYTRTNLHSIHTISIQHVSFSFLRLACLFPTSLDASTFLYAHATPNPRQHIPHRIFSRLTLRTTTF